MESKVLYPKGSAHPSMSVGVTKGSDWPDRSHVTSYDGEAVGAQRLSTERCKCLVLEGNSSAAPGDDYPGSYSQTNKFGSVKYVGS